uniref:Uncharacterized protein n=1 Tax=Noctiluca scintillans TaxID=2966 RepID=A0A7S1AMT3_NOCSC
MVVYRRLLWRWLKELEFLGPSDNEDLSTYDQTAVAYGYYDEYYDRLPHFDEVQVESVIYQCLINTYTFWTFLVLSLAIGYLAHNEVSVPDDALQWVLLLLPLVALRAKFAEARVDGRTARALFRMNPMGYILAIFQTMETAIEGIAIASMFWGSTCRVNARVVEVLKLGVASYSVDALGLFGNRLWFVALVWLTAVNTLQQGLLLYFFHHQNQERKYFKIAPVIIARFASFSGLCDRLLHKLSDDDQFTLWKLHSTVDAVGLLLRPVIQTFPFLFIYICFLQARPENSYYLEDPVMLWTVFVHLVALSQDAWHATRVICSYSSAMKTNDKPNKKLKFGFSKVTKVLEGVVVFALTIWIVVRLVMSEVCESHASILFYCVPLCKIPSDQQCINFTSSGES